MFGTLKAAYGERIIGFEQTEPTTEVLAKNFFDAAAERLRAIGSQPTARYSLRSHVRLVRVRVWETSSSWAEYEP
jgi:6-pyruvoyltetrahydropterin/6-carboxytetrahydropterin synthase